MLIYVITFYTVFRGVDLTR